MTVLHLRGLLVNLEVKDWVKGMDSVNLMALFIYLFILSGEWTSSDPQFFFKVVQIYFLCRSERGYA